MAYIHRKTSTNGSPARIVRSTSRTRKIVRSASRPVFRTPIRSCQLIAFAGASMPRMMSGSALMGMKKALEVMLKCMETSEIADRPDLLVGMEDITQLVGYARINKLEQDLLLEEPLEKKYGEEERDYVIRKRA